MYIYKNIPYLCSNFIRLCESIYGMISSLLKNIVCTHTPAPSDTHSSPGTNVSLSKERELMTTCSFLDLLNCLRVLTVLERKYGFASITNVTLAVKYLSF